MLDDNTAAQPRYCLFFGLKLYKKIIPEEEFAITAKKMRGNLLLLLTALIWGSAFVAQRMGTVLVGPFTFNAMRLLIGGLVLTPCALLFDRKNEKQKRKSYTKEEIAKNKKVLILGGVTCGGILCVASTFQQAGMSSTTAGKAGFITALYIILVPLLGMFLHKKISRMVWGGVILSAVGLYLLCIKEGFTIERGDFLVLMCALFFALHILAIDYFSPRVNGVKMSCIQFWIAGGISFILMFLFEKPQFGAILSCAVPILYVGILSNGIAYTLQILAQKDISAAVASLLMSLESVFAVVCAWIILGEVLSVRELIGCVLVFAAVILSQLPENKRESLSKVL